MRKIKAIAMMLIVAGLSLIGSRYAFAVDFNPVQLPTVIDGEYMTDVVGAVNGSDYWLTFYNSGVKAICSGDDIDPLGSSPLCNAGGGTIWITPSSGAIRSYTCGSFPGTADYSSCVYANSSDAVYVIDSNFWGTRDVTVGQYVSPQNWPVGLASSSDLYTQIIHIDPPSGTVLATTSDTSIGAMSSLACGVYADCTGGYGLATTTWTIIGFISDSDFVASSTYLAYQVMPSKGQRAGLLSGHYLIEEAGGFEIATTSDYLFGSGVRVDWKIISYGEDESWYCLWGVLNCPSRRDLLATSTFYSVGYEDMSSQDLAYLNYLGTWEGVQMGADIMGSTTGQLLSACTPWSTSFAIGQCLYALILPADVDLQYQLDRTKNLLFERAPVGYLVRFIDILSDTSTSSLPVLSYTFASGKFLEGETIAFDPFGALEGSGSLLNEAVSDQNGTSTVSDVLGVGLKVVIYMALVFLIIHDLTGLGHSVGGSVRRRYNKK